MQISEAKRELYADLRTRFREVTGAAISEKNGIQFIVIFLSNPSSEVVKLIPHKFRNYSVKPEIIGVIKAL